MTGGGARSQYTGLMAGTEALRLLGRLEEAEVFLRDLVEFSERAYGDPSLQLFAELANLAEVLQETGSSDYDEIFLRAHEVDDALEDEPDSDVPNAADSDEDEQEHA